ncbi:chemotaxis-specific protein-glutamate methyltransferase CheB [Aromatoleum toluclasticum]|uniref:chemotaxis-specific protein-glutamate methyltransferase CheB n=1 Tax=Aromatoleum toluclasticum TaxID=92003 RepID=UPI000366CE94|nr:chemotaxis-specific protein-glutamate methyltransferase CheB [Aromatoleum toluclasticum]
MRTIDGKIAVLVVEDSPAARLLLIHLLTSDPRFGVVDAVDNGAEALRFLEGGRPDVILMDIHMSGMDGYEVTRRIMETRPVPVVICSATVDPAEVASTFRALEAGAVAVVAKPAGPGHPDHEASAAKLLEIVALMSEVRVIKRWPRLRRSTGTTSAIVPANGRSQEGPIQVVAIGASTGGPPVLQTILASLPASFPVPVLIVQHIAAGFLPGFAEWLSHGTGFPVRIAAHGEVLLPGHAYLAPDGCHMGLAPHGRIALSRQSPENGVRPAVSFLFRSVAAECGSRAVAILLTGMGRDGVTELKLLRDAGAVTVAQDAESSVVHGMPGEAIRCGGASHVLGPDKIAALLTGLLAAPSRPALVPTTKR